MRFKNYALTLVMALGLGTAGYAQSDWGVPGGHIHASEARYVTSATTSGAVEDLSYTNSSKPSTVFIDTNESFTVEQGQTFQLHVTTSAQMVWNHGVIYVDWNGDKDFDDDGELIAKVGYDSNDDGVPSGFSGTGNPSIVDFTQDITVPESATAGETRLRLQFQDAWHGSSNNDGHQDLGKNHPHNAMDDIDNGGCYDFVMNINAAVVEPAGYATLVIGEHANGQITVADSKGVSYEDGDQMPWGETITATFTPDAGYVLQTAYWNGRDLADLGLENNQFSIGISDNTESMEFSAVFVEDAVEPVGEWVEIYNEPLAWASKAGATGQTVMTCSSNFGVMRADIMSGLPYSYYCWGGTSSDYFYVTVDVPEDGTYKFSYLVKYELYPGYDGSINLNFISGENDSYETVGEAVPVEGGFEVELSKLESPEMQLTAGTHVFGIKYAENDMNDGTLYFADFRLYQLQAGEPDPEPGEGSWVSVYSNDLSGTTADEVDVTNVKKFSSSGNSTTVVVKEAQAEGAVLEGQKFGTALDWAMAYEAFWIEVNVEEAGKYKFSYRGRMEGNGTMVAELRYGATTSAPVDLTPVSGTYSFTASTVLPGALMESYELDLEAGTYAFCVYLTDATKGANDSSNFFIGDFNLYKYEEGVAPTTYTVTWATPENGTLAVTAADEALTSPATVEEGTEIVITATPAEGYELETLTVGGADFTSGETYTVNSDVEIVATFAAVVVENPWGEPTGTTASISTKDDKDRYVTSASTTGATEDLAYTNDVNYAMNNQVYINTGSSMTVEQGQSIELHVTATDDMIWCHGIVFVDWNGDYDFDDEGELIQKVGLDHEDDGAGQSFYLTGNTVMKDFTVTIEVPADATIGDTRLRLQFQDAWHAGNGHKGHAHTAMDEIDKGGVYDFDMTILEGTAPTDALITVEAENCTVRVRDFTSFEDYESGTRVPLGTQLLVSATANDGYTNATFTINGKEWNHYTAWVVEEDVHIVATAEEEQSCVINYTFDGEGLGSMTVYDVSGFSMTEVENGGSVAIGGTINVYVEMNENVNGTITINNGEPEAFDYATWEGVYTQRIKIEEGMETLDIAVKLEQGEAPAMYNVGFSITNAELADEYSFTDDNYNELVVGTNQVAEGAQLGLMVLFESNEDVSGVVKVDGEIVDEFDFESCQGMYIGTVVESVDRDLKVEVELTDGNGLGDNFVDGLAVYPTVFTESVNVAMPAAGTVTVYDMAGAAVYTTEAEEGVNVLSLGNLDNGLYLIKVEGESTAKTFQVLKK